MDIDILEGVNHVDSSCILLRKIPNSIAQIPVPVAISRTLLGSLKGARNNSLSKVITNK
jgi:hypothetical protein